MDNISASSIVALFETSKKERESFVFQVISNALDGNVDIMKLHKQVKAMEEIVKEITSDKAYRKALLEQAMLHGKSFSFLGDEWTVKETGVQYDYDNCNDPLVAQMHQELEQLQQEIKSRESWLKALPAEGMVIVDEETGETYKVYPPLKKSTTSVTIKLT